MPSCLVSHPQNQALIFQYVSGAELPNLANLPEYVSLKISVNETKCFIGNESQLVLQHKQITNCSKCLEHFQHKALQSQRNSLLISLTFPTMRTMSLNRLRCLFPSGASFHYLNSNFASLVISRIPSQRGASP